jgi:solute carrier family 25 protein 14/30
VYYSLKKVFEQESFTTNIFCAVVAGMTSSALANPTDVLKVRMQVAATAGSGSLFGSFRKIYLLEGVAGLWRGVGPTSQRAGVIAAVELPVYDGCKKYFIQNGIMDDSVPNHMISSFVASLAAVICSTPVDVVRTRLMSQKLHRGESNPVKPGKVYRGSWDCFVVTLRHEGFRALYKGFIPAWLRMGPWNLIFFTSYEQLLRLY